MKIGIGAGADGRIDLLLGEARRAEADGFQALWMPNIFGLDAIGALTVAGHETNHIELGTGVVPTYPRHPMAMAQQALTAQAASGGRFVLGIGLSHKIVIEDMFGMSYARPARHMREYLEVLSPLLRGEGVQFKGEEYRVSGALQVANAPAVSLLVAALGPQMLRLAGRLSDGTITWMTGPRTLESHIIPTISKAAQEAGRPGPRIVAGFPVVVTDDVDAAGEAVNRTLQIYGQLPSYRAMLDREGAQGPADVAIMGTAEQVRSRLMHLRDIGVTDLNAAIVPINGRSERTMDLLTELAKEAR